MIATVDSLMAAEEPVTVADLLWRAAATDGDQTAIVMSRRRHTYADVRRRASAIAAMLVERRVNPGDRVAILAERGFDAIAAYFGVLAAGAVAVIVNERLRPRQVEYVLQRAGADAGRSVVQRSGARVLLFSHEILLEHPRPLDTTAILIEIGGVPDFGGEWKPRSPGDRGLAQIIFTSGSSGLPKGVVFSHSAVLCAIETVVGYLELGADERIFSLLPFSSVYGLNQMLCAIHTKSTLVVSISSLAAQIVAEAREYQVTVIAGVPPLWLQLLSAPAFRAAPIDSLRIVQNAGGHLPIDAVRQLRTAQPRARMFDANPDQQRRGGDAELQQRAGRRQEPHRQIGVIHPGGQPHRQWRRYAGLAGRPGLSNACPPIGGEPISGSAPVSRLGEGYRRRQQSVQRRQCARRTQADHSSTSQAPRRNHVHASSVARE